MLKTTSQALPRFVSFFASSWILAISIASAGDGNEGADLPLETKQAAQGAVKFLESKGEGWVKKQKCVSCHQIPSMVWSLSAVEKSGMQLDETLLQERLNWSTDFLHFVDPKDRDAAVQADVLTSNIDTMAALLVGVPLGSTSDESWRVEFLSKLVQEQNEDGSWTPRGQLPLQKRELKETQQATTLWVMLALLRHEEVAYDADAAMKFSGLEQPVVSSQVAKSAEVWAARILVAHELDQQRWVEEYARHLEAQQNDDGGWGWLLEEKSDALATGQVLYALKVSGAGSKEAREGAARFLVDSQLPAGFWKVPGTKKASKGRATATANYWGTAWAVIGLLED